MNHENHEGPQAAERFSKLATAMFRAPKSIVKTKVKPAPKTQESQQGLVLVLAVKPHS
jgi:hypothetical protein